MSRKSRLAREKHLLQKRRNRYLRIIRKYSDTKWNTPMSDDNFNKMIAEVVQLSTKYIQQFLSDASIPEYNAFRDDRKKKLLLALESAILEKELLT